MASDWSIEWQQLLELTHIMLQRARDGDWDTLNSMAVVRQAALERFFTEPVNERDADSVANGIHAIKRIDNEIVALAKAAYVGISQEQEMLKKRQQATRAYTDPKFLLN
jgi:hypothetical protein